MTASCVIVGCDRPFDSESKVETLRVLAVQASDPTPEPGATVSLTMLVYDASPNAILADGSHRPVNIAWLGGCFDPIGDSYVECYPSLAPAVTALNTATASASVGSGTSYSLTIPSDIVSQRGTARDGTPPYGISFVFYAACAGTIVGVPPDGSDTPPLACFDDDGAPVGADGFVFGYLPLYTYPGIDSTNPVIDSVGFQGAPTAPVVCTTDADCTSGLACSSSGACVPLIPVCASGPRSSCTEYTISLDVDPSSFEPDPIATATDGAPRTVLVYASFYATDGSLGDSSKIVNDPALGVQSDYGTTWSPPDVAEEDRIWVLVSDARGGVTWWWQDVVVR